MQDSTENKDVMSCELSYTLKDDSGKILGAGLAKGTLDDTSLVITSNTGENLVLSYTDIVGISDEDYTMRLFLYSRHQVTLNQIGYEYENFLTTLYRQKNELFLKYLLMKEGLRATQIEANFTYSSQGEDVLKGLCDVRFYESALIILPQKNKPLRVPYCYINGVREENYSITVETELGERLTFTQMGEKRDFLRRNLSEAMNELATRTQKIIGEIQPQIETMKKRRLADLLKEGRAAEKTEIDKITPEFWTPLEAKVRAMGITESYDFLKELSQKDKISLGVKRSLSQNEVEDYMWFLMPIYSNDPSVPGNAVALEATTGTDEGRATYFFRILRREDYTTKKELSKLNSEYDGFLNTLNRCMIEINFRREPIYFTDDQLNDPKYIHYKFAVQEITSLQKLRDLFIGRVVHYNVDQWKSDVTALLRFNIEVKNYNTKWVKNVE
jgi:hypothetical protein